MAGNDRLARLLFMVPYVVRRDGVPVSELAEKLGITPAQLEADLVLLSMVGQPPLTPDHLIDVYVEDDIVYVQLDQSLSRPPQLTQEEARALVLGAKLVGQQETLGEELERVLDKIIAVLNPVDKELVRSLTQRIGLWQDRPASAGLIQALRRAVEEHHEIVVDYYSASSDREKRYYLRPLAVITHSGSEYLVALDCDVDMHEKLFRLDRMGGLEPLPTRFEPPAEFNLRKFRTERLYFGGAEDFVAEVHLSARIAELVAEQFAPKDVCRQADGSIVVRLSTSSQAWLARWVLPFGVEAQVLHPPQMRAYLAEVCRSAGLIYRR